MSSLTIEIDLSIIDIDSVTILTDLPISIVTAKTQRKTARNRNKK